MSRKAVYEWGCAEFPADDDPCVIPFKTEDEARAHTAQCPGTLMVRRVDKDQDWDEVKQ